jgi:site-specific DNA recombinase
VAAIEEGKYSRALWDRLGELERQRDLIQVRKVQNPAGTVRLHPRLADVYAEKVQQLEEALNDPSIREEAAEVLRSLVDRVELRPGDQGQGLEALLYGDLIEILGFCGKDEKRKLPEGVSGSQLSVVGTRNQRYLHLDLAIL